MTTTTIHNHLPRVIAFCGPADSGKSTAAAHLVERYGYTRVRMAEPLKAMLLALGLGRADVDGDRKEVSHPLLGGKTPRQVMQTLGTDWGRRMVDPDLWTRPWTFRTRAVLGAGGRVVVDDVRFDNEAALVREEGAVVEITRAGVCYREDHASECGITRSLIDHTIAPAEGVDRVRAEVDALMAELGAGS